MEAHAVIALTTEPNSSDLFDFGKHPQLMLNFTALHVTDVAVKSGI